MSGTELIMGMEEVVQHIRDLEKREENLKEALAQKFYKHYEEMDYNMLNVARTIGPDLGRMVDHLIAENKRLQEEQLTEETAIQYVYENTDEYDSWVKGSTAYNELQGENMVLHNRVCQEETANMLLRNENKKLKKEHIQNIMKTNRIATELYREVKYSLGYGESDEPDRKVMYDDIKKLKEHYDKTTSKEYGWANAVFAEKFEKYSIENEKLQEDLLYYRFYTYTLDKDGDCDLTSRDVDKFTEDEAQRKTLYERIGYEEEDYKSFGVMFVEKEDEDEDDIDFFDTEEEAQKLMNDIISSNNTSSHPYPEGKLILFRSHKYNPDYDNQNTIPIVREMKIGKELSRVKRLL